VFVTNTGDALRGYNRASVISITLLSNKCTQRKKRRVIKTY